MSFAKRFFLFIFLIVLMVPVFAESAGFKSPITPERKAVVLLALEQGGKPYKTGATGPDAFDCSGLIYYVFKKSIGKELPRTAAEMYKVAKKISPEERQPGDLMFFTDMGKISHVGIYCGKYTNHKDPNSRLNGKTVFVNAMSAGDHKGVYIADIHAPYWEKHFYCYGRVLPPAK